MTTLVVAAHPDDEVLGCGGTIALRAARGEAVHILILGEGITSRYARREDAPRSALEELHARAAEAGRVLGAASVTTLDFPDNRFDTVPLLELVKCIEAKIVEVRPDSLITHHGSDLNIDHRVTFQATLTASRPLPGRAVKEFRTMEVLSSTEWAFQRFQPVFRPSTFTDVSSSLEKKIAALMVYDGETREFPHPRSPRAIRVAAERWGTFVGLPAIEPFELVWSIEA